MRLRRRPRFVTSALAALVAVVAVQLAAAMAATASADPAVTFATPDVSGTTVTVGFAVDRFERSIGSAGCTLTDSADVVTSVSCGTSSQGSVKKATDFSSTLAGLAEGNYVFGVRITMAHGGRSVTASVPFSVDPIEVADARLACAALDEGVFVADLFWWQKWNCDFNATSAEVVIANSPVFEQFCIADGGIFHTGGTVPGIYSFGCWIV